MAHKITYAIDCAFNFKIGGFATGAYNCTCVDCKEKFIGDKRAVQCLGCAIDALESRFTSDNTESRAIALMNRLSGFDKKSYPHEFSKIVDNVIHDWRSAKADIS